MDNTIKINVIIDGVKHEMNIKPEQEKDIRRAAKLLNDRLVSIKSTWRVGGNNDYITMVAFQLAYEKIIKDAQDSETEIFNKLKSIHNKLIEEK